MFRTIAHENPILNAMTDGTGSEIDGQAELKITVPEVVRVDGILLVLDPDVQVARSKFAFVFNHSTGELDMYVAALLMKRASVVEDIGDISSALFRYCTWLDGTTVEFWKERHNYLATRVDADRANERESVERERQQRVAQPNEYLARGERLLWHWHYHELGDD